MATRKKAGTKTSKHAGILKSPPSQRRAARPSGVAAAARQRPRRKRDHRLLDALSFVSFACACGAEVYLPEHPAAATEIICLSCDDWIGYYAELTLPPAPAKRRMRR